MTRQEMFNKAYLGVIAQGAKSRATSGACMYRGPNDLKCAIGHLIDDETAQKWEYHILRDVPIDTLPEGFEENLKFLSDMQAIHDCSDRDHFIEHFTEQMKTLAQEYDLEVPNAS